MNKKPNTTDNFFKSRNGKDEYDKELERLNENRIRMNIWQKEMGKRRKRVDRRED